MSYEIFHKSSSSMAEIKDASIDLIFFSPPYNIGTSYGKFSDDLELRKYTGFMKRMVMECAKKLKKRGRLVIEVADSVFTNQKYFQLAGALQKFAVLDAGLCLETRHINFIHTKGFFELPDHGFDASYTTSQAAHSNCHQILVLNRSKTRPQSGEISYINYHPSSEHPCPEPKTMVDFILKKYFKAGMKVLDPFMGTANLGVAVLKKSGSFFGYEIEKQFFDTAQKKLKSV